MRRDRRLSIGYVYSASDGPARKIGAANAAGDNTYCGGAGLLPFNSITGQEPQQGGSGSCGGATYYNDILYCHCEAGDIQREIDCLKESSERALHQAYDEVDELNEKCRVQRDEIVDLSEKLKSSKEREKYKERQYDDLKKKLFTDVDGDGTSGSMTKSSSSANSLASLALQKISSHHSFTTLFSLKRPSLTGATTTTTNNPLHVPATNMHISRTSRSTSPAISDLSGRSQQHATGSDCSESHCNQHDHGRETEVEVENLMLKLESREREKFHT